MHAVCYPGDSLCFSVLLPMNSGAWWLTCFNGESVVIVGAPHAIQTSSCTQFCWGSGAKRADGSGFEPLIRE